MIELGAQGMAEVQLKKCFMDLVHGHFGVSKTRNFG
jgi:hypothetical protein